jgi:hypothetical protein
MRRLQSGAHAKFDDRYRWGAVSPCRSVFAKRENAPRGHPAARKIAAKAIPHPEMTQQGENPLANLSFSVAC